MHLLSQDRILYFWLTEPMQTLEHALSSFEYPGRFIIIGQSEGCLVGIYGVTARNPASKAKRYVYLPESETIGIVATDEEVLSQGNRDLLIYNAFHFYDGNIVIGNGRQSDSVAIHKGQTAYEALKNSLNKAEYEPDAHKTPRITACLSYSSQPSLALHSVRADNNGQSRRDCYDLAVSDGVGHLITTYAGPNIKPTPSFVDEPIKAVLPTGSANALANKIWEFLEPSQNRDDLRVSLMAVSVHGKKVERTIINMAD